MLFFRLTWRRMRGMRRKLGFVFGAAAWPLWAPYLAAKLVGSRGRTVQDATGVPKLRQWFDQIRLAVVFGRPPHTYYMYGLFNPAKGRQVRDYVTPQEFRGVVEARVDPSAFRLLDDKLVFEALCKKNGLPTTTTLAVVVGGEAKTPEGAPCSSLPQEDLFIKTSAGRGGQGAELWSWRDGAFLSHSGLVLGGDDLLKNLRDRATNETLIIQRRLKSHTAMERFGLRGLPTARIMTGRANEGGVSLIAAIFKVPRSDSIVDNLTSGSIGCPVHLDTGALDAGYAKNSPLPVAVHPDSGVQLVSFCLPHWTRTRELAIRAHEVFDSVTFAGWDIAIEDDGPVIVEGNSFPAVESIQQAHGPLLLNPAFRQLCMAQAQ